MGRSTVPPSFPMYVDDFASDGKVEAMTTQEVGAYFLLLLKAWREEPPGSIPNNDLVLARWSRLTPDQWAECRSAVLAAFVLGADSRYHQKRMRLEFNKYRAEQKKRSEAGRIAALSRWGPDDGDEMRIACDSHTDRIAVASPGHDVVKNKKSLNSEKTEELSLGESDVFLYWQVVFNHPGSKFTDGKKAKIRARMRDGFTVEQLKTAIDGCKSSEYHMGGNANGTVYDSIELIFRNTEKIEQFIGYYNRSQDPKRSLQERRVIDNASQLIEEIKRDASGTSYAH